MPVLSPHRSTSSGSYRSSFSYMPSYSPRISAYSERFTSRSYTDADGRRIYSRSGSITEDGVTTRFREETREGSSRRDSLSRDSGISSIREGSVYDYGGGRRDSSLSRSERGGSVSAVNVIDSVAELRNKYSPANYIPACQRNRERDNMARSKSINDIGLPPIENKRDKKKQVTDSLNFNNGATAAAAAAVATITTTTAAGVIAANHTNNDNNGDAVVEDDNGNRTSVADLRKKFDDKSTARATKSSSPPIETSQKISDNIFKKQDAMVPKTKPPPVAEIAAADTSRSSLKKLQKTGKTKGEGTGANKTGLGLKYSKDREASGSKTSLASSTGSLSNGIDTLGTGDKLTVNGLNAETAEAAKAVDAKEERKNGSDHRRVTDVTEERKVVGGSETSQQRSASRVNNFASYYPVENHQKGDEVGACVNGDAADTEDGDDVDDDITASPKLNRSTISPTSSSISAATNSTGSILSTAARRSVERNNAYGSSKEEDGHQHHHHRGSGAGLYDRTPNNSSDRIGAGNDHHRSNHHYDRALNSSPVRTLGLNGLKNIGNTCFMNSVIQCLSNTRQLLEYLRKDGYVKDINTSISSMKGALIKAFAEVIKELWSEDSCDRVVNTVSLKSQIQRFAPRFIGYAQQDAQEFLRYLLEGLHEDVNRVTEKPKPILTEIDEKLSDAEKAKESWSRYLRMDNSRIVDIFVGQLKSTLRCTHCGHASVTFDPFWDLSLPIPQRTGQLRLSQCLDSFTREETLDGDEKPTCSKCKERRKCTKSFKIQKFPKILVIHLKRFSPTERFRGKLNVTVDFPLEGLEMGNYAADGVAGARYNLYAISNHSGTTYSGHYTAYCRHPFTHTWYEYNDSRVSPISSKAIISGEAYVLFYELDGQKSHL